MTSDDPGSAMPGPDDPAQGAADDSPTEALPPAPPMPAAPAQPPATQWGAQPAPAPLDAPPPAAPLDAPSATGWGAQSTPAPAAPAAEQPSATGWGAAAAASAAPPPAGPAGQPPAGAPGQPPTQPGQWGAPPSQQPAGWGPAAAPGGAPQQPGWGPAPGAPGGPPADTWNPQPDRSNNGCLKACLIVAVLGIVLVVLAVGALVILGNQLVTDLGVDPNTGDIKQCEFITGDEIDEVLGGDGAEVIPLGGLIDATIGNALLDKRVLKDANDCWILTSGTTSAVTGRIARAEGLNASGDFQAAKAAANDGGYFAGDVSGLGDEAFCTGASAQNLSFGVLVRRGGSLVYVSLIDPTFATDDDSVTTEDGVLISPRTCDLAGEVAGAVLR